MSPEVKTKKDIFSKHFFKNPINDMIPSWLHFPFLFDTEGDAPKLPVKLEVAPRKTILV